MRAARIAAGMSQQSVADAVGVSKNAISKYERNLDMPGSEVLLRLAEALKVSVEFLFRPVTFDFATSAFRCRDDVSLPAKTLKALRAQVQEWLERYVAAEEIVGERRRFELPDGVTRRVRSEEEVERVALQLREAWDLGEDAIDNLAEVLEEKGIKVGTVGGDDAFDAVLCFVHEDEPVIAMNQERPGDRQRFNLAHELGHLMLQAARSLNREKLAHRFAGAFLASKPAARLELGSKRHLLDLYELHLLKHKYGLSMQGWIHRADDLGIIGRSTARRYLAEFKKRGWKKVEPGDQIPREEPQRLERLVRRALAEELITESRAAELLALSVREFRHREADRHGGLPVGLRA